MRVILVLSGVIGGAALGAAMWWRRHRRFGSAWVNRVIDPWLVRHGILDVTHGEIGLIEHVGRTSGIVRWSPVHPVPTDEGFRIVVPLGGESQWARNVLAAGSCRLQVGGVVHELDEPRLVSPLRVEALSPLSGHTMEWLGFRYLLLHRFGEAPGKLAVESAPAAIEPHEELVQV